jgi:N5-(cytidine 5'-diphosphoramidyl)-L-glutamine hydrolase
MRKIAVTQRVDIIESYGERRDAIDQSWADFLLACQLLPVWVSNQATHVEEIIRSEDIAGVLFTGGNSLVNYGGNAPERDHAERTLLEWSIANIKPVIGICRGMQLIQNYFGINLEAVKDHVKTRHNLILHQDSKYAYILKDYNTVNAFHDYGTTETNEHLIVSSKSEDGIVMSVEHCMYPIFGFMWHPEREEPFSQTDINLFKNIIEEGVGRK